LCVPPSRLALDAVEKFTTATALNILMTDISEYSQLMHRQELLIQAKLHLLIVDDVQADIELMAIALETGGITFTYNTAETLNDCQLLLTTQSYDAVLSDYRLPQFTAYQFCNFYSNFSQKFPWFW
jgi:PleD family two-component response regulator